MQVIRGKAPPFALVLPARFAIVAGMSTTSPALFSPVTRPLPRPGYPLAPVTKALSVVIPVADEAGNILPLTQEIVNVMDGLVGVKGDYEILFIDDASRDASRAEIMEAMRLFPQVRLIAHSRRSGKSAGTWTGLRNAAGEWIIRMDGDGQNDPADIPRLLALAWEKGRDKSVLVSGVRVNRQDTWAKRKASRFANGLRRALLDDDCPDTACALKLFRRDAYLSLPYFDGIHRFEPALFRLYKHPVITVPVNDRARRHGRSKYTNISRAFVGVFDLLGVIWLQRRTKAQGEAAVEILPQTEAPQQQAAS
jgi:dolichol-phosphate mannosyltransferase